eukprot:NODE_440_length_8587_cov_0.087300.p1 type:complete len:1822 gc:universal NODE_440_length_8587_cov_0.087300:5909-444(-)
MRQIRSILQGLVSAKRSERTRALGDIEDLLMDEELGSYDSENIAIQLIDLLENEIHSEYLKCKDHKIKDHQLALRKVIHVAEVLRKLIRKTFVLWEVPTTFSKFYKHVESVMFSPEALYVVTEYVRMAEYILDNTEVTSEWSNKYLMNLIQIYKDSKLKHRVGDYVVEIDTKSVLNAILLLVQKHYHHLLPDTQELLIFISYIWENERDYNRIATSLEILNSFILSVFPNQIDLIQTFIVNEFYKLTSLYRQQNNHLVIQLIVFINVSISILFGTSLVDELSFISDQFDVIHDLVLKLLSYLSIFNFKDLMTFNVYPYILNTCKFKRSSICLYERCCENQKELDLLLLIDCLSNLIIRLPSSRSDSMSTKKQKTVHVLQLFLEECPSSSPMVVVLISFMLLKYKHLDALQYIADAHLDDCNDSIKCFYAYTLFQYDLPVPTINRTNIDSYNWYYLLNQTTFQTVKMQHDLLYYHDCSISEYIKIIPDNDPICLFILYSKLHNTHTYTFLNTVPRYVEIVYSVALGSDLLFEMQHSPDYLLIDSYASISSASIPDKISLLLSNLSSSVKRYPMNSFSITSPISEAVDCAYYDTPFGKLLNYDNAYTVDFKQLDTACCRYIALHLKQVKSVDSLLTLLKLLDVNDIQPFVLDCVYDLTLLYNESSVKDLIVHNLDFIDIPDRLLQLLLGCTGSELYEYYPWHFSSISDYKLAIENGALKHPPSRFICKLLGMVFSNKEIAVFVRDHLVVDVECNKSFLVDSLVWLSYYNSNSVDTLKALEQIKKLCCNTILKEKRSCDLNELLNFYDKCRCLLKYNELVSKILFSQKLLESNLFFLIKMLEEPLLQNIQSMLSLNGSSARSDCKNCLLYTTSSEFYPTILQYALNNLSVSTLPIIQYCKQTYRHECIHYNYFGPSSFSIKVLLSIPYPSHIRDLISSHACTIKFSLLNHCSINNNVVHLLIKELPWHVMYRMLEGLIHNLECKTDYDIEISNLYSPKTIDYYNHKELKVLKCNPTIQNLQLYALRSGNFTDYRELMYLYKNDFYNKIQHLNMPIHDTKSDYYWRSKMILGEWDKINDVMAYNDDSYCYLFALHMDLKNYRQCSRITKKMKNQLYIDLCTVLLEDSNTVIIESSNPMNSVWERCRNVMEPYYTYKHIYLDALLFTCTVLNDKQCILYTLNEVRDFAYLYYTIYQQNAKNHEDDDIILHLIQHSQDLVKLELLPKIKVKSAMVEYETKILEYKRDLIDIHVISEYFDNCTDVSTMPKMAYFMQIEFEQIFETNCARDIIALLNKKKGIRDRKFKKEYELDEKEFKSLKLSTLLKTVINCFIKAIKHHDDYELMQGLLNVIFEYLTYFDIEIDLNEIPSKKYLNVQALINSRIGKDDLFTNVFIKINRDCPHECLLSLMSSVQHSKLLPEANKRLLLLKQTLNVVKQTNTKLYKEYEYYFQGLVELCLFDVKKITNKQLPIKSKLRHLKDVSVQFKHKRIVKYKDDCNIQTGLSQPKQISVICEDGLVYKQLLKGNDDLKQDVLIQDNFKNLNYVLTKNKQPIIRTYLVIPLAPKTGVIEWVESVAIGSWHNASMSRYNGPGMLTTHECREMLKSCKKLQDKQKMLLQILSRTRPILKHFFFEHFKDHESWYSAKFKFIQSTAINNVIGALLGIGDRHLMNLLLDKKTGEIIHIDFGFAFEQSKLLPCPEYVPFRLTREFVDCFGVYKIQGPYTIYMEECLDVFRKNSRFIMTSIEILKYDPLVSWTISEEKLKQVQHTFEQEIELVPLNAERVVLQVKRKMENGYTVEHQIKQWIEQARNIGLLSQLFYGWQAWN